MAASDPPQMDGTAQMEVETAISVEELRSEITGGDGGDGSAVAELVADVEAKLFGDQSFTYDDALVKTSLKELILTIVGTRSGGSNGKQVIEHIAGDFDTSLSPGTVYPALHDLEEEGFVELRELVRTKEYSIDDAEAARTRVSRAARQHLALGMVLQRVVEERF